MHTRWMHCAGMIAFVLSAWAGSAVASESDQPFILEQNHRRDPFTFRSELPGIGCFPVPNSPKPPIDDFGRATHEKLAALYNSAEGSFLNDRVPDALRSCDEGLGVLQQIPLEARSSFSREENQLLRLRTAANHVLVRQDAEREFALLNISLTGVVAHGVAAQAIVNSKIVARGAVVPIPNAPQDVVVLEIRPNEVVFLYRGFHMAVAIKNGDK